MITIGHLAKTYGMLPSQVLANATTYDIMIQDVYSAWERYNNNPNDVSQYKEDDLLKLIEKSK